jgi:hypothetical protein
MWCGTRRILREADGRGPTLDDPFAAQGFFRDTSGVADAETLRRLGAGRWETHDGRFRVEPQSGTWMVIDTEEADDLGLPLTRGPFRSLTAAREAIGAARHQGSSISPLAGILEAAKALPAATPSARQRSLRAARAPAVKPADAAWLGRLDEERRRLARRLLRRLEKAGVSDAAALVRAELVDDRPALTQLAIERRLGAVVARAGDPGSVVSAVVECLVSGDDPALGVGWRLTDAAGRPIRSLSLAPEED